MPPRALTTDMYPPCFIKGTEFTIASPVGHLNPFFSTMVKRKLPAQASCFERRRKLRCGQLSKRAENPTAKSTGLLDLLRELRDMIYDYALVSAHSVSVLNLTVDFRHHLPKQRLGMTPSLLVASKFVYTEALGVLYGNNVFQAELYLEV